MSNTNTEAQIMDKAREYAAEWDAIVARERIRDASSELLEALVDVMIRHVPFSNKAEYAEKARAAIAKATGETA